MERRKPNGRNGGAGANGSELNDGGDGHGDESDGKIGGPNGGPNGMGTCRVPGGKHPMMYRHALQPEKNGSAAEEGWKDGVGKDGGLVISSSENSWHVHHTGDHRYVADDDGRTSTDVGERWWTVHGADRSQTE